MEKNGSATQKVCLVNVLVYRSVLMSWPVLFVHVLTAATPATSLPHTVLSNIHSVLLKVTFLLARGDGSVLSWLVERCHLVLALRG